MKSKTTRAAEIGGVINCLMMIPVIVLMIGGAIMQGHIFALVFGIPAGAVAVLFCWDSAMHGARQAKKS